MKVPASAVAVRWRHLEDRSDTTFLHTKYDRSTSYYEIFLLEFSKLLVIVASLLYVTC